MWYNYLNSLVRLAAANRSESGSKLLYYGGCWLFIYNYPVDCRTTAKPAMPIA